MERIFIFVLICSDVVFAGLPSTITPCYRSDSDISTCIINKVIELKPRLATGKISDEFSVPSLEPLKLSNIEMSSGPDFKAVFSNLLVRGPSSFHIEMLKVDLDNLLFDFVILLPKLSYNGKYALKMRLLLLDLSGTGDVKGLLENTRARVRLRGEKYNKNGKIYMRFEKFQVKILLGISKIHLDNLFNGDPTLGQAGNRFINDNIELFSAEVQPGLERSLAETFTMIANEILQGATLEEIFPA